MYIMKGERPPSSLSSTSGSSSEPTTQGYASSAYDWWYGTPTKKKNVLASSSSNSKEKERLSRMSSSSSSSSSSTSSLFTTEQATLVDSISENAMSYANYLNVQLHLDIGTFTVAIRDRTSRVLLDASLSGRSIVEMWANGSWKASSKITSK